MLLPNDTAANAAAAINDVPTNLDTILPSQRLSFLGSKLAQRARTRAVTLPQPRRTT
jgi:hypothetical protein